MPIEALETVIIAALLLGVARSVVDFIRTCAKGNYVD